MKRMDDQTELLSKAFLRLYIDQHHNTLLYKKIIYLWINDVNKDKENKQ